MTDDASSRKPAPHVSAIWRRPVARDAARISPPHRSCGRGNCAAALHQDDWLQRQVPGPLLRLHRRPGGYGGCVQRFQLSRSWSIGTGFQFRRKWMGRRRKELRRSRPKGINAIASRRGPRGRAGITTHTFAGRNLHRATYTGQYGALIVTPRQDPARYDQEVVMMLHGWDPFFTTMGDGSLEVGLQLSHGQ